MNAENTPAEAEAPESTEAQGPARLTPEEVADLRNRVLRSLGLQAPTVETVAATMLKAGLADAVLAISPDGEATVMAAPHIGPPMLADALREIADSVEEGMNLRSAEG